MDGDIVEHLRYLGWIRGDAIYDEAADEIERLRAIISRFVAADENPDDSDWDDAYAALHGEARRER